MRHSGSARVAGVAAGLLAVGVTAAWAAEGFPTGGDRINTQNGRVWIRLGSGFTDQPTVKKASGAFGVPAWQFNVTARRLDWAPGIERGKCILTDFGASSLTCDLSPWKELHVAMGDLADTFVADNDLPLSLLVRGEEGPDYIRTGNGKDTLDGGSGNDVLRAGDAADLLIGSGDDDTLDGGKGADDHVCGDGTGDKAQYQARGSKVTVTLDNVANDGETGEGDNIRATCENVEGWNGADSLSGSSGSNRLYGREGNDTLSGGGADDWLYRSVGDDTLKGDAGNDRLNGEDGSDTITGGAGADTIRGDAGNDVINVNGDGSIDTVFCGGGTADIVFVDATDRVDIGTCEQVVTR